MEQYISEFHNPSPEYRPAPLWVWNDAMSKEQIDFQLTELATHGFGGAFVHPRPGMVTEYLSDEWFELWGYALKKAKELGITLSIYDENSYPSGFAGGHVSAMCPDALAEVMRLRILDVPAETDNLIVAFAVVVEDDIITCTKNLEGVPVAQWTQYGEKFLVIHKETTAATGWMAGFSYVDILQPKVHKTFLEMTHEQYYKHFGADFGTAIPAIFTDEPSVTQCGPEGLYFSWWFTYEFQKRNGYDLVSHLPCVFSNVAGECFQYPATKVRFDYYHTIHELWIENNIAPTGKWCEEHGINWTGHYYEHLWPHVSMITSPAMQSYYEHHQWPAIDMLLSHYLKDRPTHSITHTIRELKSAVNQFGKEKAVCELYGAGGWDSTFEDYKRMADWVMVNGVNSITPHLTYSTIMGARKHDHPQSFDWRQPWWNELKEFNDYLARACTMLSKGRMEQRILLLNPSTTAYLTEAGKADGGMFDDGDLNCIRNPDMTAFLTLSQRLSDLQWDFDLGDEYTLARHAKVEGRHLRVGNQQYSCVIISECMKNMLSSTVDLIKAASQNGVEIIAAGEPGCYVDGQWDDGVYSELKICWTSMKTDLVPNYLEKIYERRISATDPFPEGFAHMRRKMDDGNEVWFFVNHAMQRYKTSVIVEGKSVHQLDLFDGSKKIYPHARMGDKVVIPLDMVRNQSLMLLVSNSEQSAIQTEMDGTFQPVDLKLVGITREKDNYYPICYADYGDRMDTYVEILCNQIYRERGFDSNPWSRKVQFKRNVLDRNVEYDENSSFSVCYHVTLADNYIPKRILVIAEHPDLCEMVVNGATVQWKKTPSELDHHFGCADISYHVHQGENTIEIRVRCFNVLMELDAIYLQGDFSVNEVDGRWVLDKPMMLHYGSWKEQGLPFYPYAVEYAYDAFLNHKPEKAMLDAGEYRASVISVSVNGQSAGLLHCDGIRPMDISDYLSEGNNQITLRICGTFKNLMGPHFVKARGTAWPAMWQESPEFMPDASEYDLLDYGLMEQPKLYIIETNAEAKEVFA
jgi:hypothetical protein